MTDRRADLAVLEMHLQHAMNELRAAVDVLSEVGSDGTDVEDAQRELTEAELAIQRVAVVVAKQVTS